MLLNNIVTATFSVSVAVVLFYSVAVYTLPKRSVAVIVISLFFDEGLQRK
jgi:hypothetical protein